MEVTHIIPLGSGREHDTELDLECWCLPDYEVRCEDEWRRVEDILEALGNEEVMVIHRVVN